jgi:hypothetical protein
MKAVEQGRHGGSRCEFAQSWFTMPRLLCRPTPLVLTLPMFETADLPSGGLFWGGFAGMFCLFRVALLSASVGAVYWLGMVQTKRGDLRGEGLYWCCSFMALLSNCAQSMY